MKITSLTKEQTDRFGEWSKKWIDIGLSTDPADFDLATKAALRGYELANIKKPMVILRVSSPYAATVGGAMAWLILKNIFTSNQVHDQVLNQVHAQVRAQVHDQVYSQVYNQVSDQVLNQVSAQVYNQVSAQVLNQVLNQVHDQVLNQVHAQVHDQVHDQVLNQVHDQVLNQVSAQVYNQVSAQVLNQVLNQVHDQVRGASRDGLYNYFSSSLFASFASWVSFFRDIVGVKLDVFEKFSINEDLVKSCGWVWWHENVLAISDRPKALNRDDQGRLHCETGPSIAYRDGWSMHHFHGVKVDSYIVENPEKITVKLIESETNAEVRRVMIERYGQAKYLLDSGAKEIHSDDFGTLYHKDVDGDEPLVMVKVINSTPEPDGAFKDYFLRVPPNIKRAREAVAWTFGKSETDYAPAIQT